MQSNFDVGIRVATVFCVFPLRFLLNEKNSNIPEDNISQVQIYNAHYLKSKLLYLLC